MNLKDWITDAKLEEDGVWELVAPEHDDKARILIARMGNPKYQQRFAELLEPHLPLLREGKLERSVTNDLGIQAMGEHVLLSWEGIEEDGVKLEPTLENRLRALRESRDFLALVSARASDRAKYRRRAVEDASGN